MPEFPGAGEFHDSAAPGIGRPAEESSQGLSPTLNKDSIGVVGHRNRSGIVGVDTQTLAKLVVVVLFFVVWSIIYDRVNRHGASPERTIHLTRPVDLFPGIIQPWTAVIYVFGGLALPVLPFAYNWSWPRLRFVLACYTLTSILAFTCYWLWPVGMIRPIYTGDSLGERLMRGVFSIDREANCFPSGHTFFATLGAILVSQAGASRVVRRLTWVLAVTTCATTVTTGQHYFIDVPGGVVAALVGYAAARTLFGTAAEANSPAGTVASSQAKRGG